MRILFASQEYFPKRGGLQASVDTLVRRLTARGHHCALLVSTTRGQMSQPRGLAKRVARKLFNRPIVMFDRTFPYPVYRTPIPLESLSMVRRSFKPDIMVCVMGGAYSVNFYKALFKVAEDLPTMTYVFDVEGIALTEDTLCARSHIVANAEVVASVIAGHRRRPPVVPCIVDPNDSQIESTREVVLYINPHPRKGEDLAWAIAEAASGLHFVFQETWQFNEERRMEIIKRANKLGNVEFRTVTDQPSQIYRDARVLLVPYGPERPRVVDEAQANGIPVVASNVSGLNESVGTGGILLDPDGNISEWVSVLERLDTDKAYYEEMVAAAVRHSQRQEIQPDYLVDLFECELQYAIQGSRAKQNNPKTS